ncbi:hypothetical protein FNO01nite_11520 [Flavobacterium noncentrifugens]|nr:hypothetical protein FNO01nite_11520 [Flavobacterium noncentrifugens]
MIFALALLNNSCSDDGADGKNGIDGATGTANVIYSEWLSMSTSQNVTIDGTSGKAYDFAAPQITADVMAKGVVLSYLKFDETNIFPTPYTSIAGGFINTITSIPAVGNLKLFRFRHDAGGTVSIGSGVEVRYVIIPGGVAAKRSVYENMSYKEVCAALHIPE